MAILKKQQSEPAVTSRIAKQTKGVSPSDIMASAPLPTAKPRINSGAPTSITTKTSGQTRPTINPQDGTASSGSNLGKTLTSALAGAGLGVGAKYAYDKLTGKPTVVPKTTPTRPSKPTTPQRPTTPTKPTTPTRPTTPTKPTKPTTPTKPKPPTGGGSGGSGGKGGGSGGAGGAGAGAGGVAYDDDGNLMPGYELDEDGNPVYVGFPDEEEIIDEEEFDDEITDEEDMFGGTENDDGSITYTYDDGSTVTVDADGNVISTTEAEGYDDSGDFTEEESGYEYYEDEYGNIYDNNGDLVYSADEGYEEDSGNFFDEYGNEYDSEGYLVNEAPYDYDYGYEDEPEYTEDYYYEDEPTYEDDYYYDDSYYDDSYYEDDGYYDFQKGGFVTLMKDGGVPKFDEGGVVDTEMFDDGSYIDYYEDGSYVTYDSDGNIFDEVLDENELFDNAEDNRYSSGDIQYFDDGSYIQTFDDGSTITVDSEGNIFGSTDAPDYSVTGGGTGSARDYYNQIVKTPAQIAKEKAQAATTQRNTKSALDTIKEAVGGSGYLGAGAAGAVLGALLGDSSLFGGGGSQKQKIDMTKVGVINPRTTDFGVGPATYVPYADYTARETQPDLYGDELMTNLNAPGYNPVNEGDYGYEEPAEAPAMAEGGLPTAPKVDYYTFGKSVDPITNLMNPRPAAQMQAPMAAQGGLGQQQLSSPVNQNIPQGMSQPMQPNVPQGSFGGMKSGGLPAVSNVPLTRGRLDFRQGSAVHGEGDGQSDDIPAMLADGEYVIDAETVAQIGNGSTKAGAQALDKFRENIRGHKRSAPLNKIPPKTKALTSYLKKGK